MELSNLDFILIFAYFAVLLIIGYMTSRKQKEEDYLIAERKLGTWSTMATMNASKSGSIFMIFVALTYLWGIAAIWYFVGIIFGSILFIPFALRLKEHSKGKYYTLADYFKYNYGKKAAYFTSIVSSFLMFGFLVLNLIAGAKIFVFFTGWAFWLCATIMVSIVLLYLLMGGFKAVVRTDIIQYIAMIFILAMLALILFQGSIIPVSDWNFFNVDVFTMVGFFLIGILVLFSSPDLWQRVYSAKGKKELKNGLIWAVVFYAILASLIALVALTIKSVFPAVDPDLALIYGFGNLLPAGLVGLSVIFLFAAIMSSIDTYIFTAASSTVQDFFDWDKKKTVKNIKRIILVLAIFATLISILIHDLVIGSYIFIAAGIILSTVVIATWIKKTIKQRTIVYGLVFGIIAMVTYMIFSLIKGEIQPTIVIVGLGATIIGLLVGGIVSYFRK